MAKKSLAWDRAIWSVKDADGEARTVVTQAGATWALRALIAAKSEGLRPFDTSAGKWSSHVSGLRALGISIADLPAEGDLPCGFRLACAVAPGPVRS